MDVELNGAIDVVDILWERHRRFLVLLAVATDGAVPR